MKTTNVLLALILLTLIAGGEAVRSGLVTFFYLVVWVIGALIAIGLVVLAYKCLDRFGAWFDKSSLKPFLGRLLMLLLKLFFAAMALLYAFILLREGFRYARAHWGI